MGFFSNQNEASVAQAARYREEAADCKDPGRAARLATQAQNLEEIASAMRVMAVQQAVSRDRDGQPG